MDDDQKIPSFWMVPDPDKIKTFDDLKRIVLASGIGWRADIAEAVQIYDLMMSEDDPRYVINKLRDSPKESLRDEADRLELEARAFSDWFDLGLAKDRESAYTAWMACAAQFKPLPKS